VGGAPFDGSCSPGVEDLVITSGTAIDVAGDARSLALASPVRTDELVQATLSGLPGDRVWLRYSFQAGAGQASPFYDGAQEPRATGSRKTP